MRLLEIVTQILVDQSRVLRFLKKPQKTLDLPVLLRIVRIAVRETDRMTDHKDFKYKSREFTAVVIPDAERSIGYAVQNQL
jgi:hypothetical protein